DTIGKRLFQYCDNIQEVVFPERIVNIPESTFSYSGVVDYVVPAGIEKIETFAFYDAKQLESITIPVSVKTIGKSAFKGCDSMTHIYYEGTLEEWRQINFVGFNYINITVVCTDGETIA
ncbi:MAG: leucine-rich repeat domain-containing protein, partial [Clostridia bacterium]|nr:leucine-rich repeat domain-containing protein [Clostridia bacterium]